MKVTMKKQIEGWNKKNIQKSNKTTKDMQRAVQFNFKWSK